MNSFQWANASTVEDAVKLLKPADPKADPDEKPHAMGGLKVGATATIDQLAQHPDVQAKFPGLAEAAGSIGSPQIRNLGTIGGNLCQRPRCWYFRLENYQCRKKGGSE